MRRLAYKLIACFSLCCGLSLLTVMPIHAQKIPALSAVPSDLAPDSGAYLTGRKQELEKDLADFQAAGAAFNAKDAKDQTDAEFSRLSAWRKRYIDAAKAFNLEVAVIGGINEEARRLGWSAKKREHLDKALVNLRLDTPPASRADIAKAWQDVKARGPESDVAREATRGEGPAYPSAGTQTGFSDCAIFALANAARLPYGVVAARATELIRQGNWRSAEERANPQTAIEKRGLNGGEVILLAETFGRSEVVKPAAFAATLRNGRPVLVNVEPGHEVVLAKTFRYRGETWYEMINSHLGPQERQYVRHKELNVLLLEKGVAFHPEPGTVPVNLSPERSQ